MRRRFGAVVIRVDGGLDAVHDEIVYPVFDVRRGILIIEDTLVIRVVLGKYESRAAFAVEPARAVVIVIELDCGGLGRRISTKLWSTLVESPRPGVAKPDRRQEVQWSGFGTAVGGFDPDQDIVRPCFGVLDRYVKVAVVVEDAGVNQFEFKLALAAPAILLDQPGVGEFRAAGTCKETSCRNASASSRDSSNIP